MGVALLLGAVGLLAMPGLVRPWGRSGRASDWAHGYKRSLVLGASMFELAAIVYAIPTVAGALGFEAVAQMCRRVLEPFVVDDEVGTAAALVAVIVPVLGLVGLRRARRTVRRAYVEGWLGEHELRRGYELVTLESPVPVAVAVPGPVPQVVVTRAIVEQLSSAELAAVVRHEVAHLKHGHAADLAVASVLEHALFFVPLLRASTAAWRTAIERWADDTAAGSSPERRGHLRDALLGTAWMLTDPRLAAFSGVDCLVERLDALDTPPRSPSRVARSCLYAPAVLGTLVVALALGRCMGADAALFA